MNKKNTNFGNLCHMVLVTLFALLVAPLFAGDAPDANGDYVVVDSNGRQTFVIAVDPKIRTYLDSIDPDRIQVVRYGDLLYRMFNSPHWNMKIDGEWVDFQAYISPYDSSWESQIDPEVQSPRREDVDVDAFKAAVVTTYGDWGDKALGWISDSSAGWGCDLVIVDGKKIKIRNGGIGNRNVIEIGRSGDPFDYAGKFQELVWNYASDATQDRLVSYKTQVEGFDDIDAYMQVQKQRLEQAMKVVAFGSKLYLSGISFFSTPGAIVMGWDDVQKGHWSGLLAFLPALPVLAKTGRALQEIKEIVIVSKSAIAFQNGRKIWSGVPLMRIASEDLALLRNIRSAIGEIKGRMFTFSGEIASRLSPVQVKKLGSWFLGICRGNQCVAKGTLVWTPRGAVPIESIEVGQVIQSWDEGAGSVTLSRVSDVMVTSAERGVVISVSSGGKSSEIRSTSEHPFLVRGGEGNTWVCASELKVGQRIIGDGVDSYVTGISEIENPGEYYNLEVGDEHTFIVGMAKVVCHNRCVRALFKELKDTTGLTSDADVMRRLLSSEEEFAKAWPVLRATAQKSEDAIVAAVSRENMGFIRDLMLRIKKGNHEWVPRNNITQILEQSADPATAWLLLKIMDKSRSKVANIWFNKVGKNGFVTVVTSGGVRIEARAGHTTNLLAVPPVTAQKFADEFHLACDNAFRNSLVKVNGEITGLSRQKWTAAMEKIQQDYFTGAELVKRQEEYMTWLDDIGAYLLP